MNIDPGTALAVGAIVGPSLAVLLNTAMTFWNGRQAAKEALKAEFARAQISHDTQEVAVKADLARAAANNAAAEAAKATAKLIEVARWQNVQMLEQNVQIARIEDTADKTHSLVNDANTVILKALETATQKIAKDNPNDVGAQYDASAAASAVAAKNNGNGNH